MEDINVDIKGENKEDIKFEIKDHNAQQQIAGAKIIASAIIVAGLMIVGAIVLVKGNPPTPSNAIAVNTGTPQPTAAGTVTPVSPGDRVLGNPNAKITLIMYEDFQCPFCGKFVQESEQQIRNTYIKDGRVQFVYRDFSFLGPESERAAEAARCAGDQEKFWDYHDYLFSHQNGENKGAFSDVNLKSFAVTLGLNATNFSQCLDTGKYAKAVSDSTAEGNAAGVTGTPKGFVMKNGQVLSTIDGAIPTALVTAKLDTALK